MPRHALMVLVLLVVGCDGGVSTQVLVRFDADAETRDMAHSVRITVLREGAEPHVVTEALAGPVARLSFPFVQPLHPRDDDPSRGFHIVGELLDAQGTVFNRQAAVGRYAAGERREVRLYFEAACSAVLDCRSDETCIGGACAPACIDPAPVGQGGDRTPVRSCARYRKTVRLDGYGLSRDLLEFPLLVGLQADSDLAEHAGDDGSDLVFVDATDAVLDHELVTFDGETGRLVAWVKVPAFRAGTETTLHVHFGGGSSRTEPSRVWTSYLAVYHLDDTDGTAKDATAFHFDGRPWDPPAEQAVPAVVDTGVKVGGERRIRIGDPDHLDFGVAESFGYSAWLKLDPESSTGHVIWKGGQSSDDRGYSLTVRPADNETKACIGDGSNQACALVGEVTAGVFVHLAAQIDRETQQIRLYRNGQEVGTRGDVTGIDPDLAPGNDRELYLGGTGGCCVIDAIIDEARIWMGVRSEEWLASEYESQRDPRRFITLGALEEIPR